MITILMLGQSLEDSPQYEIQAKPGWHKGPPPWEVLYIKAHLFLAYKKCLKPKMSFNFICWMLNKGQLGILSPKRVYLVGGERIAFLYVQMWQAMCTHYTGRSRKSPFIEGKRRLRGGAVTTIELCCKYGVLPVGLSWQCRVWELLLQALLQALPIRV